MPPKLLRPGVVPDFGESRFSPLEERDEIAVEVERRELPRAEVSVLNLMLGDWMEDVARAHLFV